ncbi:response regulator [Paraflavitalea soli]|uniref:Response regulator n=1 Tax=Paraflavitalea soli TaxID=2315862 RepID=A0A3B7MGI6_9BACT|nr:response regulator [Paraflavitalea soli]AXY72707.1 response regulator [Paraflavitalea soli]
MTKGPIIIVDDDHDDRDLYAEIIHNIGIPNEIRFFGDGLPALEYLLATTEQPFIILCDINMPRMNGLEFKGRIQDNPYLREKGIPFVFISTHSDKKVVRMAHLLSVQGYFEKPTSMNVIRTMLTCIFDYWERCKHINNT